MDERRTQTRVLTLKTGKIVSVLHNVEMEAAVLDISEGGACLLVSNITAVPDTFQFHGDYDSEAHSCEVRWKSGYKVGIRFQ